MAGAAGLNPGALRHQISWLRPNVTAQNTFGSPVLGSPAFIVVATCKASVAGEAARELMLAQQQFAEARYVLKQHYYAGLTPDLRLSWYVDGQVKTLDVLSIAASDDGRVQTIIAKDHVE